MFPTDPRQRVLLTANVPPQRRDWCSREVRREAAGTRPGRLPEAVWMQVVEMLEEAMGTGDVFLGRGGESQGGVDGEGKKKNMMAELDEIVTGVSSRDAVWV